jgi:hypothetical protein
MCFILVLTVIVVGYFFVRFHMPTYDTGLLGGLLKNSIKSNDTFMMDNDVLHGRWYFGKPHILFYTLLFRHILPFHYEIMAGVLYMMILLSGYLVWRIGLQLFEPDRALFGAILSTYMLIVTYCLCPLRYEIFILCIAYGALNICLKNENGNLLPNLIAVFLCFTLALSEHTNGAFVAMFMVFYLWKERKNLNHSLLLVAGALICIVLAAVIIAAPGLDGFFHHLKLMQNDGDRFSFVIRVFEISGQGFYKNSFQFPLILGMLAVVVSQLTPLVRSIKNADRQNSLMFLYVLAVLVFFCFFPSASWRIYSVYMHLPIIYLFLKAKSMAKKKHLSFWYGLAITIILVLAPLREWQFNDKLGYAIGCYLFVVIFAFFRFRFSRRLIYWTMPLLVTVFLVQEGYRHKFLSTLSAHLKATGQKTFVTDPIFEFMGLDYDIRPPLSKKAVLADVNREVMLLTAEAVDYLDLPQLAEPDYTIQTDNHFVLQKYQNWNFYLTDRLKDSKRDWCIDKSNCIQIQK